jgi:hypothetical protein
MGQLERLHDWYRNSVPIVQTFLPPTAGCTPLACRVAVVRYMSSLITFIAADLSYAKYVAEIH